VLTASCEVEEATQATTGKRKSKRGWFKGTDKERAIDQHIDWEIGTTFSLNLRVRAARSSSLRSILLHLLEFVIREKTELSREESNGVWSTEEQIEAVDRTRESSIDHRQS
jgi:hypothetical protein